MTARELKHLIGDEIIIVEEMEIKTNEYLTAWISLDDLKIYQSVNGILLPNSFSSVNDFAEHVENLMKP